MAVMNDTSLARTHRNNEKVMVRAALISALDGRVNLSMASEVSRWEALIKYSEVDVQVERS